MKMAHFLCVWYDACISRMCSSMCSSIIWSRILCYSRKSCKMPFNSNLGELIGVTGVLLPHWEMPEAEAKAENSPWYWFLGQILRSRQILCTWGAGCEICEASTSASHNECTCHGFGAVCTAGEVHIWQECV